MFRPLYVHPQVVICVIFSIPLTDTLSTLFIRDVKEGVTLKLLLDLKFLIWLKSELEPTLLLALMFSLTLQCFDLAASCSVLDFWDRFLCSRFGLD
jgi:hypothetical protein